MRIVVHIKMQLQTHRQQQQQQQAHHMNIRTSLLDVDVRMTFYTCISEWVWVQVYVWVYVHDILKYFSCCCSILIVGSVVRCFFILRQRECSSGKPNRSRRTRKIFIKNIFCAFFSFSVVTCVCDFEMTVNSLRVTTHIFLVFSCCFFGTRSSARHVYLSFYFYFFSFVSLENSYFSYYYSLTRLLFLYIHFTIHHFMPCHCITCVCIYTKTLTLWLQHSFKTLSIGIKTHKK